MNKLSIVVLVFAAACSKGGIDGALDKMDSFKTQVCACKDAACVDTVKKDMDKWMEANGKNFKDTKPSETQKKRASEIKKGLDECAAKVEGVKIDAAVTKMKGLADAMCACKDAACANKVNDEMTAYGKSMMDDMGTAKPTEAQMKAMSDASTRLGECMTKAMAPADAEGSAAGSAEGSAAGSAK